MTAARRISRLAVGDVTLKPVEDIYDARRDPLKGTRNERVSDYLPFDSRAGISIQHYFPVDGEYVFKIRIPGLPVGENDPEIDPYQVRIPVKAGLHWGRRDIAARESEGRKRRPRGQGRRCRRSRRRRAPGAVPVDLRLNGARFRRFGSGGCIRQLVIGGPYGTSGRGVTASRSKIFTCEPKTAAERRRARRRFSRRWRAAHSGARSLLPTFSRCSGVACRPRHRVVRAWDSAGARVHAGLARFPLSHRGPPHAGGVYGHRNLLELASRLSFFLWSSIPDEELLDLAIRGRLQQPGGAGPAGPADGGDAALGRSSRTSRGSGSICATCARSPRIRISSPNSTTTCARHFSGRRSSFSRPRSRDDRSVIELLTADYTFLNERLARHYGIPSVYGNQFRRVTYPDRHARRTARARQHPFRHVVSRRERHRCCAASGCSRISSGRLRRRRRPTCPGSWRRPGRQAPPLRASGASTARRTRSVRRATRAWTRLGFALENFDGVGKWRTATMPARRSTRSGRLPDGSSSPDPRG